MNIESELRELLARPMPDMTRGFPVMGEFDPWDILPVYGNYNSEFDDLAIDVLTDLVNGTRDRNDLASEMFREMLCCKDLCDYGTSPRGCFPATPALRTLFALWLEKWKAYRDLVWREEAP